MGRRFDPTGVKQLLDQSIEHPHWDDVAQRCLSCGNCTMVCPTCFCSTVVDSNDLATGAGHAHARVGIVFYPRVQLHHPWTGATIDARSVPSLAAAQAVYVVGPVRHERVHGLRAVHHLVPGGDRLNPGGRSDPASPRPGYARG